MPKFIRIRHAHIPNMRRHSDQIQTLGIENGDRASVITEIETLKDESCSTLKDANVNETFRTVRPSNRGDASTGIRRQSWVGPTEGKSKDSSPEYDVYQTPIVHISV